MLKKYTKPTITDIGDLRELTASTPKFGPVVPAAKPKWGSNSSSAGTSGFSGRTTNT